MDKVYGQIWTTCNNEGNWVLELFFDNHERRIIPKPDIIKQFESLGLTNEGDEFIFEDGKIRRYDKLKDDSLEAQRMYYSFFKTIYEHGGACGVSKEEALLKMKECECDIVAISNYRGLPIQLEEDE